MAIYESDRMVLSHPFLQEIAGFGDDWQRGYQAFLQTQHEAAGSGMKIIFAIQKGQPKSGIGNNHLASHKCCLYSTDSFPSPSMQPTKPASSNKR